jgi:hypothetical protein
MLVLCVTRTSIQEVRDQDFGNRIDVHAVSVYGLCAFLITFALLHHNIPQLLRGELPMQTTTCLLVLAGCMKPFARFLQECLHASIMYYVEVASAIAVTLHNNLILAFC